MTYLPRDSSALEVGCYQGGISLYLASHGIRLVGVDINPIAIQEAISNAAASGAGDSVRFEEADILQDRDFGSFDLVLLIRVLTCFPDVADWRRLLDRAHAHVKAGGLLYVHDFLTAPDSENYRRRYEAGLHLGWRAGNFAVNGQDGQLLFVAHHHSEEELELIASRYQKIFLDIHDSLSMNGNACRMFEFIGRRTP